MRKKKKRKKKKKKQEPNENVSDGRIAEKPLKPRTKTTRPKANAVVIKATSSKTYAEILGVIKKGVKLEDSGAEVRRVRKTVNGDVLLELGTCRDRGALTNALQAAVATTAKVSVLNSKARVEILDLDSCTYEEEIRSAIRRELGEAVSNTISKIFVSIPNNLELRMAVIELEEASSLKLMKLHKIKDGWAHCRIRQRVEVTQCFKCFGFGHTRRECDGPDRSNLCWRCGKGGHQAKECTGSPHCVVCAGISGAASGHILGSGSCGIFREALKKQKALKTLQ